MPAFAAAAERHAAGRSSGGPGSSDTDWDAIEADLDPRVWPTATATSSARAAVALGHIGGDAARDGAARPTWRARGRTIRTRSGRRTRRGDGTRFNSLAAVNPRTLQAATRALGYCRTRPPCRCWPRRSAGHSDPEKANLFLAEAAVEALGRIGTPEAEAALIAALPQLKDYFYYVGWYGDHPALFACHASPVHYLITEALDAPGIDPRRCAGAAR